MLPNEFSFFHTSSDTSCTSCLVFPHDASKLHSREAGNERNSRGTLGQIESLLMAGKLPRPFAVGITYGEPSND